MAKRKKYDWEAIEGEYRASQLSICEIGRRYGLSESYIRKKAKDNGWERNLAEIVRGRIESALMRDDPSVEGILDESKIVEQAALRGAEKVRTHRVIIKRAMDRANAFLLELENPKKIIAGNTKGKPIYGFTPVEKTRLLDSAVRAVATLVPLERQTYNLDKDEGPEGKEAEYTRFPNDDLTMAEWQEEVEKINKNKAPDTDADGN